MLLCVLCADFCLTLHFSITQIYTHYTEKIGCLFSLRRCDWDWMTGWTGLIHSIVTITKEPRVQDKQFCLFFGPNLVSFYT